MCNQRGNTKTDREMKYRQEIFYFSITSSLAVIPYRLFFVFSIGSSYFLVGFSTHREIWVSSSVPTCAPGKNCSGTVMFFQVTDRLEVFYGAQYYPIIPFENDSYEIRKDLDGRIRLLILIVYYVWVVCIGSMCSIGVWLKICKMIQADGSWPSSCNQSIIVVIYQIFYI
jgi:hypothetical protein